MNDEIDVGNRRKQRKQRLRRVMLWPVRACRLVVGYVASFCAVALLSLPSFLVLGALVVAGLLLALALLMVVVLLLPVAAAVVGLWMWMVQLNAKGERLADAFERWGRRGA